MRVTFTIGQGNKISICFNFKALTSVGEDSTILLRQIAFISKRFELSHVFQSSPQIVYSMFFFLLLDSFSVTVNRPNLFANVGFIQIDQTVYIYI